MTEDKPPTVVVQPQGVVGVASETINALSGSPLLLVMVLLNCVFIGCAAWYLNTQQMERGKLVEFMFDRCLPEKSPRSFSPPPNEHQG